MSDKAPVGSPPTGPPVGHVSYPIRMGAAAAAANNGSAPSAATTGTSGNKQQQQPAATGVAPPGYDYYAAQHHHHNYYKHQQQQQQQQQHKEDKPVAVQNPENGHVSGNQKKMSHVSSEGDNDADHRLEESPIAPEVGGIYAPLLKVQYQRQMDNAATVPLPPRIIGGLRDQMEHGNACNCQKSNCLKLYCECYTSGIYCNPHCTCQSSCQNDGAEPHQYYRNQAILGTLRQNPDAFRPRRPTRDEVRQHQQQLEWQQQQQELRQGQLQQKIITRHQQDQQTIIMRQKVPKQKQASPQQQRQEEQTPCNCRKSRCLKKYCECFSSGFLCLRWCNCRDCMNVPGSRKGGEVVQPRSTSNQPLHAKTATGASNYYTSATATTTTGKALAVGINNNSIPVTSAELATPSAAAIRNRLPPSMVADPMKIINLEIVSLAFGHASTDNNNDNNNNKRKTPYGGEIDNYMLQTGGAAGAVGVTAEAAAMVRRRQDVLSRDGPPKKAKPQPTRDTQAVRQKEMEGKWAMETQDVTGTFHAMRQELLEREQAAGLRNGDIALSREYSYYDIIGSAQLAAVELDLADVVESVREAGDRARTLLEQNPQPADEADDATAKTADKEHDKGSQAAKETSPTEDMEVDKGTSPTKLVSDAEEKPKGSDPFEESLLCTEEDLEPLKDDPGARTTSAVEANVAFGTTREKAVVQAAEDAAMMRELARIIRRRALEIRTIRACKYDITP